MYQSPQLDLSPGPEWFGLMQGNSRRHWAKFTGSILLEAWDEENSQPINLIDALPLIVASVVPEQTQRWQKNPLARILTLADIPLKKLYPTLGIDRALALLGAGTRLGWPILVIDAGTALTLTGVDSDQNLVGGAILPGLGLQASFLARKTAALPQIQFPQHLPQRWATQTPEAIQSGIIYTLLAGIQDFIHAWWRDYPASKIVLTGGDRNLLKFYLSTKFPDLGTHLVVDPHLIFAGMAVIQTGHAA